MNYKSQVRNTGRRYSMSFYHGHPHIEDVRKNLMREHRDKFVTVRIPHDELNEKDVEVGDTTYSDGRRNTGTTSETVISTAWTISYQVVDM